MRRFKIDPFIIGIVSCAVLGLIIPVPATVAKVLDEIKTWAIALLFFLYGARLRSREVLKELRSWKLQVAILLATFLLCPLLAWATSTAFSPLVGHTLALGLLFVGLLPSTVQSSVTMTSIARGNIAASVCAATISTIAGVVLTPLLALLFLGQGGQINASGLVDVFVQIVVPFALGQLVEPKLGNYVRRHRMVLRQYDQAVIWLIVFAAMSESMRLHVWTAVKAWQIGLMLLAIVVELTLTLACTWYLGKPLKFAYGDRVSLLMCGSKKSLTTGLPLAGAMFSPAMAATVAVPMICFHQLQLLICSALASWLETHLAPPLQEAK